LRAKSSITAKKLEFASYLIFSTLLVGNTLLLFLAGGPTILTSIVGSIALSIFGLVLFGNWAAYLVLAFSTSGIFILWATNQIYIAKELNSLIIRPEIDDIFFLIIIQFATVWFAVFLMNSLKRANQTVKNSEEKFHGIFYVAPTGMCIVRISDGRYLEVNEAFLKLIGYDYYEVVGYTVNHLSFWNEEGLTDTNSNKKIEVTIDGKHGERKIGLLTKQELNLNGDACLLISVMDVTENKNLEEQLLHSQKMQALGQLAGGVAHDFNNLLTIITGYSELLLDTTSETPGTVRREIEEIKNAGERAAALTRQLLAFSRRSHQNTTVLNINHTINNTTKMLKRLIGEDIELRTQLDPSIHQIKADEGQLEQIIFNLVTNARDAMPDGGILTLETSNVYLDEFYCQHHYDVQPGEYVFLSVSDNGTGIDNNILPNIFNPFFTTKGPGKGTGLGLSTVHGIVKQSGGHIWVYSEKGMGTNFKLYFPRVQLNTQFNQNSQPVIPLEQGNETILLVEDEESLRQMARKVLEQHGYTVYEANGIEAETVFLQHREKIQLLLTDLIMPQINGNQLAERLEKQNPGLKVLFMSGYTERAMEDRGLILENAAFLQKPFTHSSFVGKVQEVLGGARR
jgi:PAS domain S-box-containing protein